MSPFKFEMPLRTRSPNIKESGRTLSARRKKERSIIHLGWTNARARQDPPPFPVVVTLTRIAPRPLDGWDNLRWVFKSPVDQVTTELGLTNDDDPRVTWRYDQKADGVRNYAVRVLVEPAMPEAPVADDSDTKLTAADLGDRCEACECDGLAELAAPYLADACRAALAELEGGKATVDRPKVIAQLRKVIAQWENDFR